MTRTYLIQKSALRKITAVCTIIAVSATTFAAISAQSMKTAASKSTAKLSEDQRILHVLNRLGFGARPGDVERVKATGVDRYIEQQLSPDKIDDAASEAKLQNLETLRMTTAELYERYPQPGAERAEVDRVVAKCRKTALVEVRVLLLASVTHSQDELRIP